MSLSLLHTFCSQSNLFVSSGKSRFKDLVLKILLLLRSCRWMAYHDILVFVTFTNGKVKYHWYFYFSSWLSSLASWFQGCYLVILLGQATEKSYVQSPWHLNLQAPLISPSYFCRLRVSWVSLDTLKEDSSEAVQLIYHAVVWGRSPAFLSIFWCTTPNSRQDNTAEAVISCVPNLQNREGENACMLISP